MNMTFEELKADIGIFEYYNTGFIVHFENNIITVEWSSIKALFGYKVDLYTVDVICLDIFEPALVTSYFCENPYSLLMAQRYLH
jgi:hypothetical protein